MIPATSPHYTYQTVTTDAYPVRSANSYNGPTTPPLKIVYRRYVRSQPVPASAIRFNLVFFHGTGMNKAIWHYHIDQLYRSFSGSKLLQINTVISIDAVNHGESAFLNRPRLGSDYYWQDGAYDLIKILSEDEADSFVREKGPKINVAIGHSLGGFTVMYASYLKAGLINLCVPINPVCYTGPDEKHKRTHSFAEWLQKGYLTSSFTIEDPAKYYEQILKFYKTRTFYTRFHPDVLVNMLEDELPKDLKPEQLQKGDTIQLNSATKDQMIVYSNTNRCPEDGFPSWQHISIPVYHIVGELDLARTHSVRATRDALKNVVKPIDIPGAKHLANGEEPELITRLLELAFEEQALLFERRNKKRKRVEKI